MLCENIVMLIGNLATDPQEITGNTNGAKFKLATNESHFNRVKNEFVVTTEFHPVKCWKQNAEYALKNLKKGDYLRVIGKLHHHSYTTADGHKGVNTEVIASRVLKLNRDKRGEHVEEVVLMEEGQD